MNMAYTIEELKQLNQRASALNAQRQRSLGTRDSTQQRLDQVLANYKAQHGVDLTPETLQNEYNKVYQEVQVQASNLQSTIESIERGEYKATESTYKPLEDPEVVIPKTTTQPTAQPTQPVQPVQPVQNTQPVLTQASVAQATQVAKTQSTSEGTRKVNPSLLTGFDPTVEQPLNNTTPEGVHIPEEQDTMTAKVIPTTPSAPTFGQPISNPTPSFGAIPPVTPTAPTPSAPTFGSIPPVAPSNGGTPTFGQAPSFNQTPTFGQAPSFSQPSNQQKQDISEQAVTPVGWGTPDVTSASFDPNKQFGSLFNSNNQ